MEDFFYYREKKNVKQKKNIPPKFTETQFMFVKVQYVLTSYINSKYISFV